MYTFKEITPIRAVVESTDSENLDSNGIFIGQDVYNKFYNHQSAIGEYVDIYRLPMFKPKVKKSKIANFFKKLIKKIFDKQILENCIMLRLKIQGVREDNITIISTKNISKLGCDFDRDVVEIIPVNPYAGFKEIKGI